MSDDVELRDGRYRDVKRVYDSLTDDEKDFVTPGRRVYKDLPSRLAGRAVAYEGRDPVGFCDAWGMYGDGRVRPSPMLCLAVSDRARGNGLAGRMSDEVLRKVLRRVAEMREREGKGADRVRRFVWRLRKDNDASARAAARAGFTEQFFPKPHGYRQFVMSREEAEKRASAGRMLPKDMDFPAEEHKALTGRDSIVTHRVSDDARRFRKGDNVRTPWGDEYAVVDRSDLKKVEDSPYYGELTDSQRRLLRAYRRIALLRLEKKAEMDRSRIQAQYARHPQESLARLVDRLARRKWGPEDVAREYESHSREYAATKEDKEFLDRYIIARIGERYDRGARAKQALMRRLWEKRHSGESFDAALPGRMARFRQYENIPFPISEKRAAASDIEAKARLHYPAEGSHGWNHIQDVLANARRMRRRELQRNELAAIMYHDSSLMTGDRETHAEDSAEIARRELAGLFRKRQLADIVNAIAHHRASYEGARCSRLEDLVAAADRPVPDLAKQVARSWRYHEELGEPEGLRAENVASHLKEKYGHGGYAYGNAPKLYLRTYGRELRDIMSKFDGLTPESVAAIMSGTEKKAGARIDIHSIYDEVRRAYSGMGYPVSGDRLVVSGQPTYNDGRPVPKDVIKPNSSGGNTQNDGTVRINPDYRAVMRHWGLKGSGRDFLRTIIGHELGHHVDRTVLSGRAAERRRLLREISRSGFHTVYTDSYGPGTDRRKLDKELLAEYLGRQVSARLTKSAALKPPTGLEAVKRLVAELRERGLRKVRFSDLFAGRPEFSLFRGANALPAHAHATPASGDFVRNIVNGVRYEHFTPYPDAAHSYGRFLTVLDASKYRPLMDGSATLSPDFSAMRAIRYLGEARPSKSRALVNKFIMRNPHQVGEIDNVVIGPGGTLSLQPALNGSARDLSFEVAIPVRYADRHSRVYIQPEKYPVRFASLENGGIKPVPDAVIRRYDSSGSGYGDVMRSRGGQLSLTNMMVQNPDYYVYDAEPVQRLARIMHRHPEFRGVIEPAISDYLGIGASGMAGL